MLIHVGNQFQSQPISINFEDTELSGFVVCALQFYLLILIWLIVLMLWFSHKTTLLREISCLATLLKMYISSWSSVVTLEYFCQLCYCLSDGLYLLISQMIPVIMASHIYAIIEGWWSSRTLHPMLSLHISVHYLLDELFNFGSSSLSSLVKDDVILVVVPSQTGNIQVSLC